MALGMIVLVTRQPQGCMASAGCMPGAVSGCVDNSDPCLLVPSQATVLKLSISSIDAQWNYKP